MASILGLLVTAAVAREIPLTTWTVPPYRASGAAGGLTTMVDISPGVGFVAMQPCRVVDTRGGGVFTGAYGPPIMAANAIRAFDINSAPHCTGVPAGADAYSLNFTVTQTAGPSGDIRAWPTGNPPAQVTSVLNWTVTNATLANATIVPAGTGGSIDVQVAGSNTHLLIDINGYFTDEYNAGVSFHAVSGSVAPAILGENTSTVANAVAIQGVITSTAPGANAAAVRGINNGTGSSGHGVWGSHAGQGRGVLGTSAAWYGVQGTSSGMAGVGVFGRALAQGRTYGVSGQTDSIGFDAAGVFGVDGSGTPSVNNQLGPVGVRGESRDGYGVLGLGNFVGVSGSVFSEAGGHLATGYLGFIFGANYGVYSIGNAHVAGTFTATTNKGFVQPHPHDASREIRYISLEGPHTEVYFRGTAQVSQGVTRILIPQHFRFVADPATYSTLVTPVGAMATVAVLDEGPEGIVVQASRNVKVHYVVYAEREAVRNPDPIIENVHFRSDPELNFLAHLPDTFRQLMIQNGTLNPDGTVNMETARRLGWDKEWEKRRQPAPQPAE